MTVGLLYLEQLADNANFAKSEVHPTSMDIRISGPRQYYYRWRKDLGMDILTFENPVDASTAKLFRYSRGQIHRGVDLTKDRPTVVGVEVAQILQRYHDSLIGFLWSEPH